MPDNNSIPSRFHSAPGEDGRLAQELERLRTKWHQIRGRGIAQEKRSDFIRSMHALYRDGVPLSKLAAEVGCSTGYLSMHFTKLGLPTRSSGIRTPFGHQTRKDELDVAFFSTIRSPQQAYFLGLLFADGNIAFSHKRPNGVRLRLKQEDQAILEQLARAIVSGAPVSEVLSNETQQAHLCIWSVPLANDLLRLGVIPNRTTLNTPPPKVPDALLVDFWRGVFDGDGHIQRCNKSGFCLSGWEVGLSGNLATVTDFANFAGGRINHGQDCEPRIQPNGRSAICHKVLFFGPAAIEIMGLLYGDNAEPALPRKAIVARLLFEYFEYYLNLGGMIGLHAGRLCFLDAQRGRIPNEVKQLQEQFWDTWEARDLGGFQRTWRTARP